MLLPVVVIGLVIAEPSRLSFLGFGEEEVDSSKYILFSASKRPFRVTVDDRGTVASQQSYTLTNSVEGSTTILWIAPEGLRVSEPLKADFDGEVVSIVENESLGEKSVTLTLKNAEGEETAFTHTVGEVTEVLVAEGQPVKSGDQLVGDVVCELDSSGMIDRERQQRIKVTQARATLERAMKNADMQKIANDSNSALAVLNRDLAKLDLTKFEDGQYIADRDKLAGDLKNLQLQLATAQDKLEFDDRNAKKGYVQLSQLEKSRLDVLSAQIALDDKKTELMVLEKYEYERQIKELRANALEFARTVDRVKLAGDAALAQETADRQAAELKYKVEVGQLEKLERQIAGCRMVAGAAGEVVYAPQESKSGQPVMIEEGTRVRERQDIIQLPDLSKMKVDLQIPEAKIGDVAVGNPALVRLDAYPDQPLKSSVSYVSSIAAPGSWPNTDIKSYTVTVLINDARLVESLDLRPGLTASVEIVTEETQDDVLQVPAQAVINIFDRNYLYVFGPSGPERVEVLVASASAQTARIAEFDRVDLNEDGVLTLNESGAFLNEDAVARIDTDEDSSISRDEFDAVNGIADGDQVLMNPRTHFQSELDDLESQLSAEREEASKKNGAKGLGDPGDAKGKKGTGRGAAGGKPGGRSGAAGGKPGDGEKSAGQPDPETQFKSMDKNGDGKFTKEEAPETPWVFAANFNVKTLHWKPEATSQRGNDRSRIKRESECA